MKVLDDVEIMRVYIGESDMYEGRPLYEAIVEEARLQGLTGATVVRGVMGFGAGSLIHTSKILRLSEDLPMVVEVVDRAERIEAFLPLVDTMVGEGTIVLQKVRAVFHCPLRIRDVMSREVATVGPDDPVFRVAELLVRHGVKAAPVLEDGRLVGIITGGDLLKRGGMGLRLSLQRRLPPELQARELERLEPGLTAREIMTSPVVTIGLRTRVAEAARIMAGRNLKRLPVVDDRGRVVGIVSRLDILRTVSKAAQVSERLPDLPGGLTLTAGEVMFREVPTARPEEPLAEALDKLVASPLRRVVVTDGSGKVEGLVTDRDLMRLYSRQSRNSALSSLLGYLRPGSPNAPKEAHDPLPGTVGEVMQTSVWQVTADTPIREVLDTMVARQAKRLVVTDGDGNLLGMVDRDSLIKVFGAGS